MLFYFAIFFILFIFSLCEIYGLRQTENKFFFSFLCFFLFILSFIRWKTGTDWETYNVFFDASIDWNIESEFEWGFARINEVVKILFDNYTVLLFILAIILFFFQSTALLKFSPYPVTSLLFLWSISFANIFFVRQSIATAILFFSIKYIRERKLFNFLLCLFVAMLFHRTSLIFLLAWWIYPLKIRPIIMMIGIGFSLILTVFLSELMLSLGSVFGGMAQSKIQFYIENGEDAFGVEIPMAQIIFKGFINKIFIFILSLYFLIVIEKREIEFRGYLNLYWVGILIYFSTISISVALVRLSFAYDMCSVVMVPIILKNIQRKDLRFAMFLIFIIYFLMRLYVTINGVSFDSYVPFKTIITEIVN